METKSDIGRKIIISITEKAVRAKAISPGLSPIVPVNFGKEREIRPKN